MPSPHSKDSIRVERPALQEGDVSPLPNSSAEYFKSPAGLWLYVHTWANVRGASASASASAPAPAPADADAKEEAKEAAPAAPRAVVLLLHGFAEHCRRAGYEWFAKELNAAGVVVVAMDHQGHGRSDGERVYVERFSDYVDDAVAVAEHVVARYPGVPLFYFGHSMGSLIAFHVTIRSTEGKAPAARALMTSGLAAVVPADVAPPWLRFVGTMISSVAPKLRLTSLDPSLVSRNKAAVEAYKNDPLNYHGRVRARWGAEFFLACDRVLAWFPTVAFPFLAIHGGGDKVALPESSQRLFDTSKTAPADKRHIVYDGAFHELFEDEPILPAVSADLTGYIVSRL
jgi:acylglycerol lipase